MKKLAAISLVLAMLLSLSSCGRSASDSQISAPAESVSSSSDPTQITEDTMSKTPIGEYITGFEMSDDLYDFCVKIGNTVYKVPMSMADFTATGATLDTKYEDEDIMIESGCSQMIWFLLPDGSALDVTVCNFSKSILPMQDCHVIAMDFGGLASRIQFDKSLISTAKGITIDKSSETDIIAAFGEPSYIQDVKSNRYLSYEQFKDLAFQRVKFIIDLETGILKSFALENDAMPENITFIPVSTDIPEQVTDYQKPTALGEDPLSGIFELDGTLYRLPLPVSELLANGWELTDTSNDTIGADWHAYGTFKKGEYVIDHVSIYNHSTYEVPIQYGVIEHLTIYSTKNDPKIVFPTGITVGMPEAQVRELLTPYDFSTKTHYIFVQDEKFTFSISIGEDGNAEYATLKMPL